MRRLALAVLCVISAPVAAQQNLFETGTDTKGLRAVPLEQPGPGFPGGTRTGQEGWVRINFVVTPDGRVADPIIVESIGGEPFEQAALDALDDWRFEEPADGVEIGNNIVEMRFEVERGRDAATSNFLRRYRRIMTHVHNEQTELARERLDETIELGGWNLYESTMLCLMTGRVEDQEGNADGKLEHYRRALAVDNRGAIKGKDRRDLLTRIFEIEFESGQYGAAVETAAALAAEPGSKEAVGAIADDLARVRKALAGSADIVAHARITSTCDCAAGQALWRYEPARRRFAFAEVDPGVERFEARCDAWRLKSDVAPGEVVELPPEAKNCRVFVFGDDNAAFRFVESAGPADERRTVSGAVASAAD